LAERYAGGNFERRDDLLAWADEVARKPPTGTINCLALDASSDISGVTTTSGLAWKLPGRVGATRRSSAAGST
jgi:N4-(beta-N-acetylglucosaminyl)-L-asparaginase